MEPKFNIYNLSLEECDLIALALDGLICNDAIDVYYDKTLAEMLFARFDEISDSPGVQNQSTGKVVKRNENVIYIKFSA